MYIISATSTNPLIENFTPKSPKSYIKDFFQSLGSYNKSDYYNFTGPPIDCGSGLRWFRVFVDDEDPNYNWSKTAAENDWCNGSGTVEDPYMIENLYINAQDFGGCIYIRNSNKHFVIKNCWLDNTGRNEYDAGVFLRFVENGTVMDNFITYTHVGALFEFDCSNIHFCNNIMISNHHSAGYGRAIYLGYGSNDFNISDNKILNFYHAIYIRDVYDIILHGNYLEDTIWKDFRGSYVFIDSTNNSFVTRNVLSIDLASGEKFVLETSCKGNFIYNNYKSTNQDLKFNFTMVMGGGSENPHTSQSSFGLIDLHYSNYNQVINNVLLVESLPNLELPVYMIVLIIGIISIGAATVAIILVLRGKKRD